MIRDPSDGSVRAPQKSAPDVATSQLRAERDPSVMPDWPGAGTPLIDPTTSGLPAASARDAGRRERDRAWLQNYRKAKQGT